MIYPMFWVLAALIGFMYSGGLLGTFLWVGIIFISVLIHELGHALVAALFGRKPHIELMAFGGVTVHSGPPLSLPKQFFITLAGPFFGFCLAFVAFAIGRWGGVFFVPYQGVLDDIFVINFLWTLINLIPVLPLDGGQLLRILFEAGFKTKGLHYALVTQMVIAIIVSLFFLYQQNFLIGALFSLFAYQNFMMWRKTRGMEESDQHEDLQKILLQAEEALLLGKIEEGESLLISVRKQTKKGMLFSAATEQLAALQYEKGHKEEAYHLFLEIRNELSDASGALLHELAFLQGNYALVTELASRAFQVTPSPEVALRSAGALAQLRKVKPAIGWLHAALKQGSLSAQETLEQKIFDPIRGHPLFQKYIEEHSS